MNGKIIKGIAGFYYIYTPDKGVYERKAKGIFTKDGIKPLVGDNVEIDIIDEEKKIGNIIDDTKKQYNASDAVEIDKKITANKARILEIDQLLPKVVEFKNEVAQLIR